MNTVYSASVNANDSCGYERCLSSSLRKTWKMPERDSNRDLREVQSSTIPTKSWSSGRPVCSGCALHWQCFNFNPLYEWISRIKRNEFSVCDHRSNQSYWSSSDHVIAQFYMASMPLEKRVNRNTVLHSYDCQINFGSRILGTTFLLPVKLNQVELKKKKRKSNLFFKLLLILLWRFGKSEICITKSYRDFSLVPFCLSWQYLFSLFSYANYLHARNISTFFNCFLKCRIPWLKIKYLVWLFCAILFYYVYILKKKEEL